MRHILGGTNLSLIYTRSMTAKKPFTHIFCTQHGIIARFYPDASCVPYFSPLYLYPETDLFNHPQEPRPKEPNLNPRVLAKLSQTYQTSPAPETTFNYIYAVLYSNTYRTKYAEFLQSDFPRLPFTKDYDLFRQLGEYGHRLVDLHLLKSTELEPPLVKFQGTGENSVADVKYNPKTLQVSINPHQYFEPVLPEVWEYQIGGYEVCHKWLKDRKGRQLSLDEIKQYCKITTALFKTIEIQKKIDELYTDLEHTILEF